LPYTKKPSFFYGYTIVAVSILILFVLHGVTSSWGVFLRSFEAEFGWSRAAISGALSLGFIMGGLFSILLGGVTDRFGSRMIITIGGVVFTTGCFLMSRVSAIWQIYLFFGILMNIWGSPANVSLLSTAMRWFSKKRGLISGIVKAGTGLGIMIIPLLSSQLIDAYGWRSSFIILGALCLIIVLPLAQFLRRDPSQKGLRPYGDTDQLDNITPSTDPGLPPGQALRSKQFWIICIAFFFMWYCGNSLMVHITPHAIDLGISTVSAASLISIIGGVSIIGRLVVGAAGDKTGNIRTMTFCFILLIISVSWLMLSNHLWQFYIFAVVYGFAHGGFFALISPLIAELFGTKAHGTLFGFSSFLGMAGGAVGPLVAGRIFDVTGSYSLVFILIIGVGVAGLLLSLFLKPIEETAQATNI
jgi:MFS family permease